MPVCELVVMALGRVDARENNLFFRSDSDQRDV
jgi:hypothetical protein